MTYERILSALSEPTRQQILGLIRDHPSTVGSLSDRLPVSQPAVSQHLRVLREAGLVRVERSGVRRIYHLEARGVAPLRQYLDHFWGDALEAFRRSFEPEPEGDV